MAYPRPRRRRLLLPTALAAILAIEVTGLAIARSLATADAPSTREALVSTGAAGAAGLAITLPDVADLARDAVAGRPGVARSPSPTNVRPPASATLAKPARAKTSASSSAPRPAAVPRTTPFHGRNHVWIPALTISAGIQSFPCSRRRPPDAGLYRWGCAGRNNVYLLGHAWSTFKPLHDAYVGGRLRAGMTVWYADGSGHVHEYSVAWWRVVAPTTAASWAWAAQSRPSMTLQTCVGSTSQYRLMVRLTQIR